MLAPDQIDVYVVDPDSVTDDELLNAYAQLLDPGEIERWQKFVFSGDRHRFLVSHALVRVALSRYVDVSPATWTFTTNAYGKPRIADPALDGRMQFSLSHTDGLAAVAVGWGREVGVDVEKVSRNVPPKLVEAVLAPPEIDALKRLPWGQQRDRFFALWTLKEAYTKARGMGLSLPFRAFWFHIRPTSPSEIDFTSPSRDNPADWGFKLCRSPQHQLALAYEAGSRDAANVTIRRIVPLEP